MMSVIRFFADLAWLCWIIGPALILLILKSIKHPHQRRWRLAIAGLSIVAALSAASLIAVTIADLSPTKPLIERLSSDVGPMMIAAVFLGWLLYGFRRSDRALYGIAEMGFGTMTAGYAAWSPDPALLPRVLALGAAIYIVVRGLDNMDAGKAAGSRTGQWLSRNSYGLKFYRDENAEENHITKGQ